jgi:hypothetical protein
LSALTVLALNNPASSLTKLSRASAQTDVLAIRTVRVAATRKPFMWTPLPDFLPLARRQVSAACARRLSTYHDGETQNAKHEYSQENPNPGFEQRLPALAGRTCFMREVPALAQEL